MMLLALILASCALSATGAKCPQPEFVRPCTCRPWETGVFVVCHQVNNTTHLQRAFQVLRVHEIARMFLKDCHLVEASGTSIFTGMNIKLLRLMDSSITRYDGSRRPGPIAALASTNDRLDLTNCGGLLKMEELALGAFGKLKDLNVIRDHIGQVKRSHLPNPSNVSNLRLEESGITSIETGAFSHMTSLKSLTLLKNQLTTITRDIFPQNCANLLSIDLSENRITSLPSNMFEGMDNLHTVNLYGNQIRNLDQDIWRPVWSRLDKLWINGNNIICDSSVGWIFDEVRQPPTLYGSCSLPAWLRGTQLTQLKRSSIEDSLLSQTEQ